MLVSGAGGEIPTPIREVRTPLTCANAPAPFISTRTLDTNTLSQRTVLGHGTNFSIPSGSCTHVPREREQGGLKRRPKIISFWTGYQVEVSGKDVPGEAR